MGAALPINIGEEVRDGDWKFLVAGLSLGLHPLGFQGVSQDSNNIVESEKYLWNGVSRAVIKGPVPVGLAVHASLLATCFLLSKVLKGRTRMAVLWGLCCIRSARCALYM